MKRNRIRVLAPSLLLLPGLAWGALTTPSTIFRQGNGGLSDTPESEDKFGFGLATGDFNGDGFQDLAIGATGERCGTSTNCGAVEVIYGSQIGLVVYGVENPPNPLSHDYFTQSNLGGSGDQLSEAGDTFGNVLCSGDFDNDGFDDLAIGAQAERLGTSVPSAGMVSVVYGSELGLDLTRNDFFTQDTSGVNGSAESNDQFGASCATGRFNSDDYADLAIGIPGEDVGAGAVQVLYGSGNGVTTSGNKIFIQGTAPGGSEGSYTFGVRGNGATGPLAVRGEGERFGQTLATGNLDGDNYDDLAIGAQSDTFVSGPEQLIAGGFHIVFGASTGLTDSGNLYFNAATNFIPGVWDGGDQLGATLAIGRFDADPYDDLLVGAPGEEGIGHPSDAGAAVLVFGNSNKASIGASAGGVQQILQGGAGATDPDDDEEAADKFGQAVVAGRYPEGSGELDYAVITATGELIGSASKAGAASVLYAGASGLLDPDEQQFFNQNTPNFGDACESFDQLGLKLATGDFNGDGSPDLAIGVPEEDFNGSTLNSGIVHILYFPEYFGELIFGDSFESADTSAWSLSAP